MKVNAPAAATYEAILNANFEASPIVRALLRAREVLMRSKPGAPAPRGRFIDVMPAMGWTILAQDPGREIVIGTVTRPWTANPELRPPQAHEFVPFDKPGYAKIAMTMRVHEINRERCLVLTETRVKTTDAASLKRFRTYWRLVSPGAGLLRRALLDQVKGEAEASTAAP